MIMCGKIEKKQRSRDDPQRKEEEKTSLFER